MKLGKILSAAFAVSTVSMFAVNAFAAPVIGVDWNKNVVTAAGVGYAPAGTQTDIQRKTLAESAAIAVAYKNLAEQVEGVQVTGETTVSGMMLVSSVVKTKVNAIIKGAKKISSVETGDGGVEVTLQMPIFGSSSSLAGVVLEKPEKKSPFPNPVPTVAPTKPAYNSQTPVQQRIEIVTANNSTTVTVQNMSTPVFSNILDYQTKMFFTPEVVVEPLSNINISSLPKVEVPQNTQVVVPTVPQAPQIPTVQVPTVPQISTPQVPQVASTPEQKNLSSDAEIIGGYTGIIIDCRGMNLQAVMSPVVKNENKETIYGDKNLDYDKIIEMGMAAYSDGVENLDRAGENPLVVKAVALDNFNSNPVLSVADSNRVLLENKSTNFLDKMNVVFLQ